MPQNYGFNTKFLRELQIVRWWSNLVTEFSQNIHV